MLDRAKFVVKEQGKMLSSKKNYEILDADNGQPIGTATEQRGLMGTLFGMVLGKDRMNLTIEFRQKADNALAFAVQRKGWFFKKVRALDGDGSVLGTYKAKMFSLSGGFHVYDKDGKHVAEIRGKLLKSEYKILTPDGQEMGTVSKKWGGMAREMFTSNDTYGVVIAPAFAEETRIKKLILGAPVAIDAIFGGGKGGGSSDKDGDDD